MRIMVFTEGTIFSHSDWLGIPRNEIVQRVKKGERPNYAGTIPIGDAARKVQSWSRAGAEIVYLTSRREPSEVEEVNEVLQRYGFPSGQMLFRLQGEEYKDVAERALPDVIVEDDCESIGGEIEMTYPHICAEIKAGITSIVVKEFGGIDHLPNTPSDLISYGQQQGQGKSLRYLTVLFDWGDTIMRDDPSNTTPMIEWETVEVIEGITDVLAYLHSSGRRIILATSASISDESQIRGALARGGLDLYFSRIYCFKNTNLPKEEEFYRYILNDLNIPASAALMVGDSFEKDIQIPNSLGIFAVWFNPRSDENRKGELHITVHSMRQLQELLETSDHL